jgi:hypothetical protein
MYSNSNQLPTLPDTLARLGLHRDRLGCIMLDIGPLIPAGLIPEEALYTSANPDRHWIRGAVGVDGAHVTLKYGLDPRLTPADVDSVLDGWSEPETIGFADLELFESPYEDDPYTCIRRTSSRRTIGCLRCLTSTRSRSGSRTRRSPTSTRNGRIEWSRS